MKNILVTGGSGFIGGHIIHQAHKKYEVYATYNNYVLKENNIRTIQIDLSQKKAINSLLKDIKPDIIIHTAAISNLDLCEKDRVLAYVINVEATETLALWSKKNGAKFIFTSSDMVFDGKRGNYREDDSVNPLSFYAQTKVQCEGKIAQLNFNSVVVRVALTYGIGRTRFNTFFEKMISNIKSNKSVALFVDQFRTPILVNNLAEAILELAGNEFTGIINLSGGETMSRWDFGLLTCKILGLPTKNLIKSSMFDYPGAAFRPQDISMRNDLASKVLNVKLLNCSEGLYHIKETIEQKI